MSRRGIASIAVGSLAVFLVGACGSHGTESGTSHRPVAANAAVGAAVTTPGASDAKDSSTSTASATKSATASREQSKPGTAAAASSSGSDPASPTTTIDIKPYEGDYVFGSPVGRSSDDPRPSACTFKPGELCRLRVQGTYHLVTQDVASIRVAAFEDDSTTPASSTQLPNAKKGSAHWYIDQFPYQARAGVKNLTIAVTLLDANGHELAKGKPTTFPTGA